MSIDVERNENGELLRTTSEVFPVRRSVSDFNSIDDYGYESNIEEIEEDVQEESFDISEESTDEEGEEEGELIERNKELIQMIEDLMSRTKEVQSMYYKEKERKEIVLKELEKEKRVAELMREKIEGFSDLLKATKAVSAENEKLINELDLEKKQHSMTLKRLAELEDGSEKKSVDGSFLCVMEMTVINGEVVQSRLLRDLDEEFARLRSENQTMLNEICKMKLTLEEKKGIEKELGEAKLKNEELQRIIEENSKLPQQVIRPKIEVIGDTKVSRKSIMKLKKMMSSVLDNTAPQLSITENTLGKTQNLSNSGRHSIMCQTTNDIVRQVGEKSTDCGRKSEAVRFLNQKRKNVCKNRLGEECCLEEIVLNQTVNTQNKTIENIPNNHIGEQKRNEEVKEVKEIKEEEKEIKEQPKPKQIVLKETKGIDELEDKQQKNVNNVDKTIKPKRTNKKEDYFSFWKIVTFILVFLSAYFIYLLISVD